MTCKTQHTPLCQNSLESMTLWHRTCVGLIIDLMFSSCALAGFIIHPAGLCRVTHWHFSEKPVDFPGCKGKTASAGRISFCWETSDSVGWCWVFTEGFTDAFRPESIRQALIILYVLTCCGSKEEKGSCLLINRKIRVLWYNIIISCLWAVKGRWIERQRKCLFECHATDSTARNISRSWDSEPKADFLSYSSHSTNLSETRVSEWSVKSKCQSILSSTLGVLACKIPWGELNLNPPLSFSHPAATSSPKPGRKCHIEPPCLWQEFVGVGGVQHYLHKQTDTDIHTHTHTMPL